MTISELLNHSCGVKIKIYIPAEDGENYIDIFRGDKNQIPDTLLKMDVRIWGINRGFVDIETLLGDDEEFINKLSIEEITLWQKANSSCDEEARQSFEAKRKVARKVLRDFVKNVSSIPHPTQNMLE